MTLVTTEIVCDSCGYRCCAEGIELCKDARREKAGFCTREEYERRRVEAPQLQNEPIPERTGDG